MKMADTGGCQILDGGGACEDAALSSDHRCIACARSETVGRRA